MYDHLIFFFAADLFMSFCPSCKCSTLFFQPAPQPKAKKAEKKKRKRPKKGNIFKYNILFRSEDNDQYEVVQCGIIGTLSTNNDEPQG